MVFPRMCAKQRVQIFHRSALYFDLKQMKNNSIVTRESLSNNRTYHDIRTAALHIINRIKENCVDRTTFRFNTNYPCFPLLGFWKHTSLVCRTAENRCVTSPDADSISKEHKILRVSRTGIDVCSSLTRRIQILSLVICEENTTKTQFNFEPNTESVLISYKHLLCCLRCKTIISASIVMASEDNTSSPSRDVSCAFLLFCSICSTTLQNSQVGKAPFPCRNETVPSTEWNASRKTVYDAQRLASPLRRWCSLYAEKKSCTLK